MFRNNRPRYWVSWYDRWHLLLLLLLALLLCWLGYLATLPAPEVTLRVSDPHAAWQSDQPVTLQGNAPANSVVRVYDGDRLVGEARADGSGAYKIVLTNVTAGAHSYKAVIEADGARIESRPLALNVSAPVVAIKPTSAPTATPPPTATSTRAPTATLPPTAAPTAMPPPTAVPTRAPTATTAPPTIAPTPTLAAGAMRRRGKDNAEMLYVPAGEFAWGDPPRMIYLDAFWIDKSEVTSEQFQQFVEATGYKTQAEKQGWGYEFTGSKWEQVAGIFWRAPRGAGSSIANQMKHPVGLLSWNDAAAYCAWAGARLPTEAEWEKSARGTDGRAFPWGNTWDGAKLNFCDANCAFSWKDAGANDGYAESAPVGSYPQGASPYGALDMAGNVWEWVADWYDPAYQAPARNPTGPSVGQLKILRGGAWSIDASYARTVSRFFAVPDFQQRSVGVRCAQQP